MSESGGSAASSAIGAMVRYLHSRASVWHGRKLCRARLARIERRWSRGALDHIDGSSGHRELVLAAVQSISAHRRPLVELLLSGRVDTDAAAAAQETVQIDTEASRPRALRLVYSRPD